MTTPLVILTGASGAGKTAIARRFLHEHSADCHVFFFDSIGVPSLQTMLRVLPFFKTMPEVERRAEKAPRFKRGA